MTTAVVLVAHGTVESLDDLPAFLANIRRGHPAPPELIAEVRRRYEAIGGRSPLLDITREVARALEGRLGVPVRVAMRLFAPYPKDVLRELAAEGVRRVVVVPLAQHSAHVYGEAVEHAAKEAGLDLVVDAAPNWGREPALTRAFAESISGALDVAIARGARPAETALVLSAHSLPRSVIEAGDPYESEFRASAADVAEAVLRARPGSVAEHVVCFQSQGMSTGARPVQWLGPDLRSTLEGLASRGRRHVVLAPIGFLADHVEILYDLDIEARAWADELGIATYRSASLNAGEGILAALESVARRTLDA
jgi:ferrochelatase